MNQDTIGTNIEVIKCGSLQFPSFRKNEKTRNTWSVLMRGKKNKFNQSKVNKIVASAGIKHIPVIGKLPIDFVHVFPHESMYPLLLGWTKHALSLCSVNHKCCEKLEWSFIPSPYQLDSVNQTITRSSIGII